jgi:hypothetical protein
LAITMLVLAVFALLVALHDYAQQKLGQQQGPSRMLTITQSGKLRQDQHRLSTETVMSGDFFHRIVYGNVP